MKSIWDKLLRIKGPILLVLITVTVYLGFKYFLGLVLPFLAAYFLAWLIRPVTDTLYRRFKVPRLLGGTAALLLLFGVFGVSFILLINILFKQAIAFLRNLPIYLSLIAGRLDHICKGCDDLLGLDGGTLRGMVDENLKLLLERVKNDLMPEITEHTISFTIGTVAFIGVLLIIFVSAVLITKELPLFQERYSEHPLYKDFHRITSKLSEAGIAYLRSQAIIMLIVAVICVLGLTLLGNEYAALAGIGIAVMDALPFIGSGMVFIPWAIIMLMNGNLYAAAILITIYLLCQIIREVLEPKLIGSRIGIKPLYTLISMYIGVKLFSIAGFILGPVGLVIIITVHKVINEKAQEVAKPQEITYNEE